MYCCFIADGGKADDLCGLLSFCGSRCGCHGRYLPGMQHEQEYRPRCHARYGSIGGNRVEHYAAEDDFGLHRIACAVFCVRERCHDIGVRGPGGRFCDQYDLSASAAWQLPPNLTENK